MTVYISFYFYFQQDDEVGTSGHIVCSVKRYVIFSIIVFVAHLCKLSNIEEVTSMFINKGRRVVPRYVLEVP